MAATYSYTVSQLARRVDSLLAGIGAQGRVLVTGEIAEPWFRRSASGSGRLKPNLMRGGAVLVPAGRPEPGRLPPQLRLVVILNLHGSDAGLVPVAV